MRNLLFIIPGMLLFLLYCSHDQIAGGSTDTELGGSVIVAGIINNPDGTPAVGTVVKLVVDHYNPLKDAAIADSLTVVTKSDGCYYIHISDSGFYTIEAIDPAKNLCALKKSVWVSKDTAYAGALQLTRPGAIRITLPDSADLTKGYVFVRGASYYKRLAGVEVIVVNTIRFIIFDSLPADTIPAICYDRELSVGPSVIVLNNPVVISDDTTGTMQIVESWETINTGNSQIPENNVNAVIVDKTGKLWVGTDTKGLAMYNGSTWKIYDSTTLTVFKVLSNKVVSLLDGNDGNIWVGTDSGLARFNGTVWTNNSMPGGTVPRYRIQEMVLDSSGLVVVLSSIEYIQYTIAAWYKYSVKTTSIITGLNCLVVDKQGKYLIGSNTGLYMLAQPDAATWKNIPVGTLTPDNSSVNDMALDADNGLWCATNYGIYHYDYKTWQVFDSTNLAIPGNKIKSIVVDRNNFTWVGLGDSGCIVRLGAFSNVFTAANTAALKNVGTINDIKVTNDNTIYFATKQGGIIKLTYTISLNQT